MPGCRRLGDEQDTQVVGVDDPAIERRITVKAAAQPRDAVDTRGASVTRTLVYAYRTTS
ncbi:hypothetical protein [Streptomyces sp. NPDC050535]|uniref:hypothetical protein n=1 Tax=Streptomyces sp. NPDC050535 TaxID=3365626 RepID=UPI0037A9E872